MSRFLEIYSGNRNRNQYPLTSYFEIPFQSSSVKNIDAQDPIIKGGIYYSWGGGLNMGYSGVVVDIGKLKIGSTDDSPQLDLSYPSILHPYLYYFQGRQPYIFDAYVGYTFFNITTLQARTILGYDPSSVSLTLDRPLSGSSIGDDYVIFDSSTSSSVHIPFRDINGNQILNYEQAYNGYYLVDETLSYGQNIVARKIIYYNNITRTAFLDEPFPDNWSSFDKYTLRKSLPYEKWTLDVYTYINKDPSYGPVGPVVTFPEGASIINGYYKGKYIYLSSNNTYSYGSNFITTINPFKGVYGNYYIKEYKVTDLGGGNYKREAFIDYGIENSAPYYISYNTGNSSTSPLSLANTYNKYKIPLPYQFINTGVFQPSPEPYPYGYQVILDPSTANKSDGVYNGYLLKDINTGVERNIIFYFGSNPDGLIFSNSIPYGVISDDVFLLSNPGNEYILTTPNVINIVDFERNNFSPLNYTGSMVSQNDTVCYEITLIDLGLPIISLVTGARISFYPFVYVELANVSSPSKNYQNSIYTNSIAANRALFIVPITDIVNPNIGSFVKLSNLYMTQTVKFKPNDSLRFSVYLPDGSLFIPIYYDTTTPYEPNDLLQIHAVFSIKRLKNTSNII
jgi:hypothetical protein